MCVCGCGMYKFSRNIIRNVHAIYTLFTVLQTLPKLPSPSFVRSTTTSKNMNPFPPFQEPAATDVAQPVYVAYIHTYIYYSNCVQLNLFVIKILRPASHFFCFSGWPIFRGRNTIGESIFGPMESVLCREVISIRSFNGSVF